MLITSRLSQTLDVLHTSFPRALTSYLPEFLAASLNHLHVLYPTFSHYYLSATEAIPSTSEDESIELPQLLCPVIDFLSAVIRGAKGREWLGEENILSLVESMFNYVQMTDDDVSSSTCRGVASFSHFCQVLTWEHNANAFVAQEEDETQPYSVRVAGLDLLGVRDAVKILVCF
jgi:importin-9